MELPMQRGQRLSPEERQISAETQEEILKSDLSDNAKELIRQMLANAVKMTVPDVLSIWEIAHYRQQQIQNLQSSVLWIEQGSANKQAGYQHMLKHADEFRMLGITDEDLKEIAEAATTVGTLVGYQGSKKRAARPVFLLMYKDIPLAVAISIASNGFIVGMNRQSFERYLREDPRPHIDSIGRWRSAEGPITPKSKSFQGWVIREDGENWDYWKDGSVYKTQSSDPIGEWVYKEKGWSSSWSDDPTSVQTYHWRRYNLITRNPEIKQ